MHTHVYIRKCACTLRYISGVVCAHSGIYVADVHAHPDIYVGDMCAYPGIHVGDVYAHPGKYQVLCVHIQIYIQVYVQEYICCVF